MAIRQHTPAWHFFIIISLSTSLSFFVQIVGGYESSVVDTVLKCQPNIFAHNDTYIATERKIPNTWFINPSIKAKSTLNFGQLNKEAANKIVSGQCLRILNIGGSVSCGHVNWAGAKRHDDFPHGEADSYPVQLQILLDSTWSCVDENGKSMKHNVTNICKPGTPTEVWVNKILEALSSSNPADETLSRALNEADVVIVETAANDVDLRRNDAQLAIKRSVELIIHLLWSLPKHPSVLWVSPSTRLDGMYVEDIASRNSDAIFTHLPVLKYYEIPTVSLFDGVGPLMSTDAHSWFQWWFLVDDKVHPTLSGHRMVGQLLFHLLFDHFLSLKFPLFNDGNYHDVQARPPLHFKDKGEIDSMIHQNSILVIDLTNEALRKKYLSEEKGEWKAIEDVAGKMGFISSAVGDSLLIHVTRLDTSVPVSTKIASGVLHVTLLKSYEHMGSVQVTIASKPPLVNEAAASSQGKVHVIDCLWSDRSSEQVVEKIPLMESLLSTFTELYVSFEIIPSTPSRSENKVKIISVALYLK